MDIKKQINDNSFIQEILRATELTKALDNEADEEKREEIGNELRKAMDGLEKTMNKGK
ncbi:hypothetical protein GLW08_21500 [Pontibacillus yanchengensis]|uniref:Uncharacterized protein n=2 Tax=Pontibacillus yanchengensis TaxID=462910 RepID=A0ACC7VM50_9BACI|nr:hypothetical protein [Pontibacillus yanchengensis]MYL36132.1 hypothetical protein [Pontibacillus yanchengensis]MYL55880.1 hypothetical protein [Pontibacillus yanchengensis]